MATSLSINIHSTVKSDRCVNTSSKQRISLYDTGLASKDEPLPYYMSLAATESAADINNNLLQLLNHIRQKQISGKVVDGRKADGFFLSKFQHTPHDKIAILHRSGSDIMDLQCLDSGSVGNRTEEEEFPPSYEDSIIDVPPSYFMTNSPDFQFIEKFSSPPPSYSDIIILEDPANFPKKTLLNRNFWDPRIELTELQYRTKEGKGDRKSKPVKKKNGKQGAGKNKKNTRSDGPRNIGSGSNEVDVDINDNESDSGDEDGDDETDSKTADKGKGQSSANAPYQDNHGTKSANVLSSEGKINVKKKGRNSNQRSHPSQNTKLSCDNSDDGSGLTNAVKLETFVDEDENQRIMSSSHKAMSDQAGDRSGSENVNVATNIDSNFGPSEKKNENPNFNTNVDTGGMSHQATVLGLDSTKDMKDIGCPKSDTMTGSENDIEHKAEKSIDTLNSASNDKQAGLGSMLTSMPKISQFFGIFSTPNHEEADCAPKGALGNYTMNDKIPIMRPEDNHSVSKLKSFTGSLERGNTLNEIDPNKPLISEANQSSDAASYLNEGSKDSIDGEFKKTTKISLDNPSSVLPSNSVSKEFRSSLSSEHTGNFSQKFRTEKGLKGQVAHPHHQNESLTTGNCTVMKPVGVEEPSNEIENKKYRRLNAKEKENRVTRNTPVEIIGEIPAMTVQKPVSVVETASNADERQPTGRLFKNEENRGDSFRPPAPMPPTDDGKIDKKSNSTSNNEKNSPKISPLSNSKAMADDRTSSQKGAKMKNSPRTGEPASRMSDNNQNKQQRLGRKTRMNLKNKEKQDEVKKEEEKEKDKKEKDEKEKDEKEKDEKEKDEKKRDEKKEEEDVQEKEKGKEKEVEDEKVKEEKVLERENDEVGNIAEEIKVKQNKNNGEYGIFNKKYVKKHIDNPDENGEESEDKIKIRQMEMLPKGGHHREEMTKKSVILSRVAYFEKSESAPFNTPATGMHLKNQVPNSVVSPAKPHVEDKERCRSTNKASNSRLDTPGMVIGRIKNFSKESESPNKHSGDSKEEQATVDSTIKTFSFDNKGNATEEPTESSTLKESKSVNAGFSDEAESGSGHEAKSESEHEAKLESGLEAKSESGHEAKSESGREAKSESGHEAKSESGREAKSESGHEDESGSGFEAKSESGLEVKLESGLEAKSESGHEAKLESGLEVKSESGHEAKLESGRKNKAKIKSEPSVNLSLEHMSEPDSDARKKSAKNNRVSKSGMTENLFLKKNENKKVIRSPNKKSLAPVPKYTSKHDSKTGSKKKGPNVSKIDEKKENSRSASTCVKKHKSRVGKPAKKKSVTPPTVAIQEISSKETKPERVVTHNEPVPEVESTSDEIKIKTTETESPNKKKKARVVRAPVTPWALLGITGPSRSSKTRKRSKDVTGAMNVAAIKPKRSIPTTDTRKAKISRKVAVNGKELISPSTDADKIRVPTIPKSSRGTSLLAAFFGTSTPKRRSIRNTM